MRSQRRVVFAGAYGIENSGDDAPLMVMTQGLRRRYPEIDFRFSVLARHADPFMEAAAGARFVPNLEYQSREQAAGKWFRGFNFGDDVAPLTAVEAEIRDADLVIAGAGNFLIDIAFDLFRGPIPLCATYAFMADLHRTPFMLYGITAGPIESERARRLSAWIARRSAVATCRDAASRELLQTIDPELAIDLHPDPVLGLEPASDDRFARALAREGWSRVSRRPRLAIAWRDLDFLGFDSEVLLRALRELSGEYDLLFVPQGTGQDCNDREIAKGLIERLGETSPECRVHSLSQRHSPDVLMRFYETADVTLAARLHGAVFSVRGGTPVAGLAYLPKVSSFLGAMGLEDDCIDIEDASSDALLQAVHRARQKSRGAIRERAARLGTEVGAYFDHVASALELERRAETLSARPLSGRRLSWPPHMPG